LDTEDKVAWPKHGRERNLQTKFDASVTRLYMRFASAPIVPNAEASAYRFAARLLEGIASVFPQARVLKPLVAAVTSPTSPSRGWHLLTVLLLYIHVAPVTLSEHVTYSSRNALLKCIHSCSISIQLEAPHIAAGGFPRAATCGVKTSFIGCKRKRGTKVEIETKLQRGSFVIAHEAHYIDCHMLLTLVPETVFDRVLYITDDLS
jgi:hypothetical protein